MSQLCLDKWTKVTAQGSSCRKVCAWTCFFFFFFFFLHFTGYIFLSFPFTPSTSFRGCPLSFDPPFDLYVLKKKHMTVIQEQCLKLEMSTAFFISESVLLRIGRRHIWFGRNWEISFSTINWNHVQVYP